MTRKTEQRIQDILVAIERCQRYEEVLDEERGVILIMAEDAIERNLQVIGEAVKFLPPEVLEACPGISWPQIRGFRNILVHQYFGIDFELIREVVRDHLPPLAEALRTWQKK